MTLSPECAYQKKYRHWPRMGPAFDGCLPRLVVKNIVDPLFT